MPPRASPRLWLKYAPTAANNAAACVPSPAPAKNDVKGGQRATFSP